MYELSPSKQPPFAGIEPHGRSRLPQPYSGGVVRLPQWVTRILVSHGHRRGQYVLRKVPPPVLLAEDQNAAQDEFQIAGLGKVSGYRVVHWLACIVDDLEPPAGLATSLSQGLTEGLG